ncbi:hypothetical protein C943_02719 [Mariniradius saccharolyticus AK6]|uniref:Uncharacterized protein n=1 Tax=Mariniradius saccharolyticus AK6 TaxID=1239962 RepID=M7X7M8_9BACT|nr:hypothetical protein C943_02719 [Mariniradius saccharolyticus AK6]
MPFDAFVTFTKALGPTVSAPEIFICPPLDTVRFVPKSCKVTLLEKLAVPEMLTIPLRVAVFETVKVPVDEFVKLVLTVARLSVGTVIAPELVTVPELLTVRFPFFVPELRKVAELFKVSRSLFIPLFVKEALLFNVTAPL